MEIFIKDIGKMKKEMDMEFIFGVIKINIKEFGLIM